MERTSPAPEPVSFGGTQFAVARASAAAMPSPADGGSSIDEESIGKRLREAGFDEDTAKGRDKAALIAYNTRLEGEIYNYQCNMGLILLEKKELESKYRQIKASSESAEIMFKHEKAANISALAEARNREENLKKLLGIEKECLANIEKILHEMRAESAEGKAAYQIKLAEAQSLLETAQKLFDEAKTKSYEAEASQEESGRLHNTALRTLQDVEAREDELRRRTASFKRECESKEKELSLQRQTLNNSQKILYQEQEGLMEGQKFLSQREEHIYGRLKDLSQAEKELMEGKLNFEEDCIILREEKNNLEVAVYALAIKEEREAVLDKKNQELLILQENISNKEFDELKRLKNEYQSSFERKACDFEAEMIVRRISLEDEMKMKKEACNVREIELEQREQQIMQMENSVQIELHSISDKQEDVTKKLQLLEEKEKSLILTEKKVKSNMQDMQSEKEQISKMQEELQIVKISLENETKRILHAEEKIALSANERNELLVLEIKLKEEIDSFMSQKMTLDVEADKLKSEKEKFEDEWDLIDEKREELRTEADQILEERRTLNIYLRNELDILNLEKEKLHTLLKQNADSLTRERNEFMRKMECERSDWFIKFHKERDDFLNDIKIQRRELENSICRRQEEVESYLREKEEAFEQEKSKELQSIASLKDEIAKQFEHSASELKRIDNERTEIIHDREQMQIEWSEIKVVIEELNVQREKLQNQRELLHSDRKEIDKQIQHLMKLEHLHFELESKTLHDLNSDHPVLNNGILLGQRGLYHREVEQNGNDSNSQKNTSAYSSPPSAPMTWFRKCAEVILNLSQERNSDATFQQGTESRLLASLRHFNGKVGNAEESSRRKKINNSMDVALIAASEEKYRSNNRTPNQLPLRKKRLIDAICNDDDSGSLLECIQNNQKIVRPEGAAEMEPTLD